MEASAQKRLALAAGSLAILAAIRCHAGGVARRAGRAGPILVLVLAVTFLQIAAP
jgi:hypothetical protein